MKNFLTTLWTILNSKFLYLVLLILVLFILLNKCSNAKKLDKELEIAKQNQSAKTDSLEKEKSKSGQLTYQVAEFISTQKNLQDLNKQLYDEVKDQKGQVLSLSTAVIKLQQNKVQLEEYANELETQIGESQKLNDSTFIEPFVLSYNYGKDTLNYDKFTGYTKIGIVKNPFGVKNLGTILENRLSQINLTFGEKLEDKKLKVFVTSDYPGLTTTKLSGWLIDPNSDPIVSQLLNKKHWLTGFCISLSATCGYDIIGMKPGLTIGPSFSWNIYNW